MVHFSEFLDVFLRIQKGMLEKGFAKLSYTDPILERVVNFSRVTSSSDQRMHQSHVNSQPATAFFFLGALPSTVNAFVLAYRKPCVPRCILHTDIRYYSFLGSMQKDVGLSYGSVGFCWITQPVWNASVFEFTQFSVSLRNEADDSVSIVVKCLSFDSLLPGFIKECAATPRCFLVNPMSDVPPVRPYRDANPCPAPHVAWCSFRRLRSSSKDGWTYAAEGERRDVREQATRVESREAGVVGIDRVGPMPPAGCWPITSVTCLKEDAKKIQRNFRKKKIVWNGSLCITNFIGKY